MLQRPGEAASKLRSSASGEIEAETRQTETDFTKSGLVGSQAWHSWVDRVNYDEPPYKRVKPILIEEAVHGQLVTHN